MIVDPGLLTHPKYLLLEREVGTEAIKYLLRLWAHCQASQRGEDWGEVSSDYVEMVCEWRGKRKKLFNALRKPLLPGRAGWIEVREGRVIIHGWAELNKKLMHNWLVGPNGGRPRKTQGLPKENPRVPENPFSKTQGVTDKIRLDKIREDKRGVHAPDSEEWGLGMVNCPPSEQEVIDYGKKLDPPAPEDVSRRFFFHHQGSHWGAQSGSRICDFRPRLVNWWEEDIKRREKKTGPETTKTVLDLKAELQGESDSKRKLLLMEQIEKLEA